MFDPLIALLQQALPTRAISALAHKFCGIKNPRIKTALIKYFIQHYNIDLTEAQRKDPSQYISLNDFFTRALDADTRKIAGDERTFISPVDGKLGQWGQIVNGRLFQAKGMAYRLDELVGGYSPWQYAFDNGQFATLYLAPNNYHRVHSPLAGQLESSLYIPGRLFGVNPLAVRSIRRLFTRNERLVSVFDTAAGPVAVIMVGAFCVSGIETVWHGTVSPPHRRDKSRWLEQTSYSLARGQELGRFNLGSTVIVLLGEQALQWQSGLRVGQTVQMGQALGQLQS